MKQGYFTRAALLVAGSLAFLMAPAMTSHTPILVAGSSALAAELKSDDIVNSLKPKKKKGLTRSLRPDKDELSADETKFLRSLPSRGIRIEMREKLDTILTKHDLPRIDIEIRFGFDSAYIEPESYSDLAALGKALTSDDFKDVRFALNGHTDASGSDDYNERLSEERALAVRDYLLAHYQIDPHQLVAIGFGESRLKVQWDPEAPENRRVEVVNLGE